MAESGVDLTFDESQFVTMSLPQKGSEKYRVVVGTRQPQMTSLSTSVTNSSGRPSRLRASQRLQLMKMQAEGEARRNAAVISAAQGSAPVSSDASSLASSLPSTADSSLLANFQSQQTISLASSQPSATTVTIDLSNLQSAASFLQSQSTIDDDDELLKDLQGVLESNLSSLSSSFNVPSVANSCIVEFPANMHDVQMEDDEGQTSSSCPLIPLRPADPIQPYRGGRRKEPPPVFHNNESRVMWMKEREKKDQHNNIEKKRRSKINDYIHELATLLPDHYDIDLQNKKGNILEASVDYIRKLQSEEKRMTNMRQTQDDLEKQNRRLQLQIQMMQLQMGLNTPASPQVHMGLNAQVSPQIQMGLNTQASPQVRIGSSAQASPQVHILNHQASPQVLMGLSTQASLQVQMGLNSPAMQAQANMIPIHIVHGDDHAGSSDHQSHFPDFDLLNGEFNLPDDFDMNHLDPIFAGLQMETPNAVTTGNSQIPSTVDDFMDFGL